MRSSTSDVLVSLRPPRQMTLDLAIEFIAEDEFVEVTPSRIRLRKSVLDRSKREQLRKRRDKENAAVS
jgi:GTP-binding protein